MLDICIGNVYIKNGTNPFINKVKTYVLKVIYFRAKIQTGFETPTFIQIYLLHSHRNFDGSTGPILTIQNLAESYIHPLCNCVVYIFPKLILRY